MIRPSNHPQLPGAKLGVLLINLGTPDAPEARAVRRYLAEFLSDPRVIEIPKLAWKPILHGVILRTRPRKSAEAYNQIWTNEGSPLRVIAHRQAEALRARLPQLSVHYAMRYGHPGIAAAMEQMAKDGCTRILAAPLYPQYCAATTATANDALFGVLARMRWQPAVRTMPPYYEDPLYIEALRDNLSRQLTALDFEPQRLLLSFHGMPERTLELGDPYHCHCQKTARLLGAALGREVDVAFQSRFGRAKWLQPATDETLAGYARSGVKRVAVAAPGFSADCLETLEELGIRGRQTFLGGGGEKFALLDCLNDSAESIAMLERLILRELAGWLPAA
ncbi:ferrochelatase [Sphingomonas segetis]|jgi:ferrochelatase|uniref:ferrochelatase n=1 Tax=Sphingomonas segetis TaxID=1104779 RepID=UPI0012D34B50|nr:ferrochelatase [Sphingomonas segetis]